MQIGHVVYRTACSAGARCRLVTGFPEARAPFSSVPLIVIYDVSTKPWGGRGRSGHRFRCMWPCYCSLQMCKACLGGFDVSMCNREPLSLFPPHCHPPPLFPPPPSPIPHPLPALPPILHPPPHPPSFPSRSCIEQSRRWGQARLYPVHAVQPSLSSHVTSRCNTPVSLSGALLLVVMAAMVVMVVVVVAVVVVAVLLFPTSDGCVHDTYVLHARTHIATPATMPTACLPTPAF